MSERGSAGERADVLIAGGSVCDGSGRPCFAANVAIRDGHITGVGPSVHPPARQTVPAHGLVVSPGFIDVHTHADGLLTYPQADNLLQQGVTTVISGQCGGSAFPVGLHLERMRQVRPAVNYATLAGHGTIRREVMGMAARRPDRRELDAMRRLAGQAMDDGALGLSSGLFYVPGSWAETAELVELCREVAARGGVYATHMRSAGGRAFEAVHEAAEVGRTTGVKVQISHLKALHREGRTGDDRMEQLVASIHRCSEQGVDAAWDVYPYAATSTGLGSVVLPEWVSEGGRLQQRLGEDAVRQRIRQEVLGKILWVGGPESIRIIGGACAGQNLKQVAERLDADPAMAAMELVMRENPRCVFHALREEDVEQALASPLAMVASDGGAASGGEPVHPRYFGTFPRFLGHYVRRRRLFTLEEAIRKCTSLPARRFRIERRGLIAEGMKADIVVFDPQRIGSGADYERPCIVPDGLTCVLVNGRRARAGSGGVDERHGEVLTHQSSVNHVSYSGKTNRR